jgi:hypothetical protein
MRLTKSIQALHQWDQPVPVVIRVEAAHTITLLMARPPLAAPVVWQRLNKRLKPLKADTSGLPNPKGRKALPTTKG